MVANGAMHVDNVFGKLDFYFVRAWPLERRQADSYSQDSRRPETSVLCGLTFELTGPLRWDGLAQMQKMYSVPAAGPRQPAVAGPVERRVRPRPCSAGGTQALKAATDMQNCAMTVLELSPSVARKFGLTKQPRTYLAA
jgi:hypothetical protein